MLAFDLGEGVADRSEEVGVCSEYGAVEFELDHGLRAIERIELCCGGAIEQHLVPGGTSSAARPCPSDRRP